MNWSLKTIAASLFISQACLFAQAAELAEVVFTTCSANQLRCVKVSGNGASQSSISDLYVLKESTLELFEGNKIVMTLKPYRTFVNFETDELVAATMNGTDEQSQAEYLFQLKTLNYRVTQVRSQ